MQKWEYAFAFVVGGKVVSVNGQKVGNIGIVFSKGPSCYDFANQLGDAGWEMVTTMVRGGITEYLVFKRPKQE